jgi:hypothetical protein
MAAHPILLAAGLLACVLHHLVRCLRWYRVADVCAIGVYSVVFPKLPDPRERTCVEMTQDTARTYERELRWHTGSVGKLFPTLYFHLQWMTFVAAFLLIWLSVTSPWFLLTPVGVAAVSWAYFHARGWRWLQSGCARYRTRNRNETND